jgi:hypothetical protein
MFRRLVLDALARAARGGEDHLARQALGGADPLVRSRLRSRVARRIAFASASVVDRSDRRHVLRLAFLQEAGAADDVDPENREAVSAAFDAASAGVSLGPRQRIWYVTSSIAAIVLCLALGGWRMAQKPAPFSPLSTPLGDALGPALTTYVVSLYEKGSDRAKSAAARDELLSKVKDALGPRGKSFEPMLAAYQELALGKREDAATREAFVSSLQQANASLHTARAPYLVDVLDDASGIFLISSYIAKERSVRAEGATIRLVHAQRLDTLNRALAVVGYTRPQLGAAVVTLDMLEREIIAVVAPALSAGGKAHIVDAETRDTADWAEPLEQRAAELLRGDFALVRTPALDHLIDLLARRDHLFWQFRSATAFSMVTAFSPCAS